MISPSLAIPGFPWGQRVFIWLVLFGLFTQQSPADPLDRTRLISLPLFTLSPVSLRVFCRLNIGLRTHLHIGLRLSVSTAEAISNIQHGMLMDQHLYT